LGQLTHKTVSEMTYNVSSGTLNSTIPYPGSNLAVHVNRAIDDRQAYRRRPSVISSGSSSD